MLPRVRLSLACLSLCLIPVLAHAQSAPAPSWRDNWEAAETMIPMRDGKKLYTVYYIPKGKTGPFPILLERTPYNAGSPARPPQRTTAKLVNAGYIFAFQDVRGTGKSEGDFVNVRPFLKRGQTGIDESTDTYDTVDYLVQKVPQNSGRVGLWGISYPGFYAGAGAVRNHPALKAVSPQAPVNDWFLGDDVHHRGAFMLQETFDFMLFFDVPRGQPPVRIDRGTLSAYDFFLQAGPLSTFDAKFLQGRVPYWKELMENDTYNQYWKDRALWRGFQGVGTAVLTVGGWFDKEDLYGALQLYKASERQNRGIVNTIVMGPWSHGGWAGGTGRSLGDYTFGEGAPSQWYQENVEFPFFERHLRGDESVRPLAEAIMFETGANEWRTFDKWPPEGKSASLFLSDDRTVQRTAPARKGRLSYVNDPAAPTPYVADYKTSRRAPGDWLARKQNFLEERKDQVTFRSAPLEADLRIAGPLVADLWVTTTGTDSDFVVQVIDEIPADSDMKNARGESLAGAQLMVRGEIIRGKFRDSFERPEPFRPGQPTRVRLELNDALHTFKKGHRITVRIQSGWFPIVDRNPNTFVSRLKATEADFRPATIEILTGGDQASQIRVTTLP